MDMLKKVFVPALLLAASMPVLATGQSVPPPPGPYQAMPQMPAMPGMAAAPSAAPAVRAAPEAAQPLPQQPSAAQIWAPPAMLQVPYWMQAPMPATQQFTPSRGGTSPDASPDNRGGGQARTTQLSPAGRAAAPTNARPGYGARLTPGYFPGYGGGQTGAGQAQMQAGIGASGSAGAQGAGQAVGQTAGQRATGPQGWQPGYGAGSPVYPGYGYGGYAPAAPGAYGYAPYPGQMPLPYWGAPAAPAYGARAGQ